MLKCRHGLRVSYYCGKCKEENPQLTELASITGRVVQKAEYILNEDDNGIIMITFLDGKFITFDIERERPDSFRLDIVVKGEEK